MPTILEYFMSGQTEESPTLPPEPLPTIDAIPAPAPATIPAIPAPAAPLPPERTMVLSTDGTDRRALRNEALIFALIFFLGGGFLGWYFGHKAGSMRAELPRERGAKERPSGI